MSHHALTARQLELYEFIRAHIAKHDIAPSFDEMRGALGFASKSRAHRIVSALEERGAIVRLPGKARAIQIVDDPAPATADQRIAAYCFRMGMSLQSFNRIADEGERMRGRG